MRMCVEILYSYGDSLSIVKGKVTRTIRLHWSEKEGSLTSILATILGSHNFVIVVSKSNSDTHACVDIRSFVCRRCCFSPLTSPD